MTARLPSGSILYKALIARSMQVNNANAQYEFDFDGATYSPSLDGVRLAKQAQAVFDLMADGKWRTLREICESIGCGSEAGVSARLRDFRKAKFGGHVVNRQRRGLAEDGVFEYQLRVK